jgi:hypothetical protein
VAVEGGGGVIERGGGCGVVFGEGVEGWVTPTPFFEKPGQFRRVL